MKKRMARTAQRITNKFCVVYREKEVYLCILVHRNPMHFNFVIFLYVSYFITLFLSVAMKLAGSG